MKKELLYNIIKIIKRIRWKPLIPVAVIALLGGLAWGTAKAAHKPSTCGACHSMESYHSSWEKSAHKNVECYYCHSDFKQIDSTDSNKTRRVLITTNKVIIFFGKSVDFLSEKAVDVTADLVNKKEIFKMYSNHLIGNPVDPWKKCFNCHQELVYSAEDDHFGHSRHLEAGASDCRQCHDGAIHGKQTKTSWQQQCADCHGDDRPKPSSHNEPSFDAIHGRDYLAGKNCSLCHQGDAKDKFCMDCHKAEIPHQPDFKNVHVPTIAKVGIRNCMNCHEDKSKYEETATQSQRSTACEACHGWEMPHSKDILQTHTSLVKIQGINSCYNCHQSSPEQKDMAIACINCHGTEMPHPPNFKRSHGSLVYAQGDGLCRYCHGPTNPVSPGAPWSRSDFCINCHMKNKPHAPGYRFDHQLIYNDPNRCTACHPDANIGHCTQCHVGE